MSIDRGDQRLFSRIGYAGNLTSFRFFTPPTISAFFNRTPHHRLQVNQMITTTYISRRTITLQNFIDFRSQSTVRYFVSDKTAGALRIWSVLSLSTDRCINR